MSKKKKEKEQLLNQQEIKDPMLKEVVEFEEEGDLIKDVGQELS
jgi:tRNA A-37 threonylcarbamoyl transferase component Bud32